MKMLTPILFELNRMLQSVSKRELEKNPELARKTQELIKEMKNLENQFREKRQELLDETNPKSHMQNKDLAI